MNASTRIVNMTGTRSKFQLTTNDKKVISFLKEQQIAQAGELSAKRKSQFSVKELNEYVRFNLYFINKEQKELICAKFPNIEVIHYKETRKRRKKVKNA